jgi:hypothetical protein
MSDKPKIVQSAAAGEPDPALPDRYAGLVIDALIDAGLIERSQADEATRIAALEIQVRQAMGDR